MVATIPPHSIRRNTTITAITRDETHWTIHPAHNTPEHFDTIILATPADTTRTLLTPHDPRAAALLQMDASSAVIVAFALPNAAAFPIPPGFGFLVPQKLAPQKSASEATKSSRRHNHRHNPTTSRLLACTFTDQKFDHRTPPGARLIRAFFGGPTAERLISCNNDEIASIARLELARILGPHTRPATHHHPPLAPQPPPIRRRPPRPHRRTRNPHHPNSPTSTSSATPTTE